MRWRYLFEDLEAQMMRAERDAFEDEVRERGTAERAAVTLGAVLAAATGVWLIVVLGYRFWTVVKLDRARRGEPGA